MIFFSSATAHEAPSPDTNDMSSSGVTIISTDNEEGRKWDKKNFCFYCNKAQAKLWRHIQSQHKDEQEVVAAESAGKDRQKHITKIRNLGNHLHNVEVLKNNSGSLIVNYRPRKNSDAHAYVPCGNCYGYFVRTELWRHHCPFKPLHNSGKRVAKSSKLLLPAPNGASDALAQVLASSREDLITRIIKSDWLIMKLGEKLVSGIGRAKDSESNIRGYLRRMARFLQVLRIQDQVPNADLESFLTPTKFRKCLAAAKRLAGYDDNNASFATPSLALKIGHTLKKCATILEGACLERGNNTGASDASNFRNLVEINWSDEVSRSALRTIITNKMNKPKLIPLTEDIVKLSNCLKAEAN
jgi:hypothetical protein